MIVAVLMTPERRPGQERSEDTLATHGMRRLRDPARSGKGQHQDQRQIPTTNVQQEPCAPASPGFLANLALSWACPDTTGASNSLNYHSLFTSCCNHLVLTKLV